MANDSTTDWPLLTAIAAGLGFILYGAWRVTLQLWRWAREVWDWTIDLGSFLAIGVAAVVLGWVSGALALDLIILALGAVIAVVHHARSVRDSTTPSRVPHLEPTVFGGGVASKLVGQSGVGEVRSDEDVEALRRTLLPTLVARGHLRAELRTLCKAAHARLLRGDQAAVTWLDATLKSRRRLRPFALTMRVLHALTFGRIGWDTGMMRQTPSAERFGDFRRFEQLVGSSWHLVESLNEALGPRCQALPGAATPTATAGLAPTENAASAETQVQTTSEPAPGKEPEATPPTQATKDDETGEQAAVLLVELKAGLEAPFPYRGPRPGATSTTSPRAQRACAR